MLLKTHEKKTIRILNEGMDFNTENVNYGIELKNIEKRTRAIQGELKIVLGVGNSMIIEIVF